MFRRCWGKTGEEADVEGTGDDHMSEYKGLSMKRPLAAALIFSCAIFLLAFLCLIGTRVRSEVPLVAGYYLLKHDSFSVVVVGPDNSFVISEQVAGVAVVNTHIVGIVEDPGEYRYPGWNFPIGYFVIDTTTGNVSTGLDPLSAEKLLKQKVPRLRSFEYWKVFRW
jgi:hypothetical protein